MSRFFAIVPACGQSVRMGRPKLLLPLAGRPLIVHTLAAWQQAAVAATLVVVRSDDAELAAVVRAAGAEVVAPADPPADMKASVQAALRQLVAAYSPTADDAFLVAPADIPFLAPQIAASLIDRHGQAPGSILIPTLAGRRGHPVLYPWPLAAAVFALAADEGLNALAARHPTSELACDHLVSPTERPFADIDTPDQYRAAGGE